MVLRSVSGKNFKTAIYLNAIDTFVFNPGDVESDGSYRWWRLHQLHASMQAYSSTEVRLSCLQWSGFRSSRQNESELHEHFIATAEAYLGGSLFFGRANRALIGGKTWKQSGNFPKLASPSRCIRYEHGESCSGNRYESRGLSVT